MLPAMKEQLAAMEEQLTAINALLDRIISKREAAVTAPYPPPLLTSPGQPFPLPNPSSHGPSLGSSSTAPPAVNSSPMIALDLYDDLETSDPNPDDPADKPDTDPPPALDPGDHQEISNLDLDNLVAVLGEAPPPAPEISVTITADFLGELDKAPSPIPAHGLVFPVTREYFQIYDKPFDPVLCHAESSKLDLAGQLWGFFLLIYHGVPTEVMIRMFLDVEVFFMIPFEEKVFDRRRAQGGGRFFHVDTSLLKACSEAPSMSLVVMVHAQAIKFGCCSLVPVQNFLAYRYASCGDIGSGTLAFNGIMEYYDALVKMMSGGLMKCVYFKDALQLFDKMSEIDVIAGSVMIDGLVRIGMFKRGLEFVWRMLEEKVELNKSLFLNVFIACAHLVAMEQGRWVERNANTKSIWLLVRLGIALVDMYLKCGCVENAYGIFAMIGTLTNNGRGKAALRLFSQMEMQEVSPHDVTFNFAESSKLDLTCQHLGFFLLINHGVSQGVMKRIVMFDVEGVVKFLLEEKSVIKQSPGELEDYWQLFVIFDEQKLDSANLLHFNTYPLHLIKMGLWPTKPTTFKDTLDKCMLEVNRVVKYLLGFVAQNLGIDTSELLTVLFENGLQFVRINSDTSCLTLALQENGVQGMHIGRYDKWVPVKPHPNAFLQLLHKMTTRNVISWQVSFPGLAKIADRREYTEKVFDQIPQRDSVSGSALVYSYAWSGYCREAFVALQERLTGGLMLNMRTWLFKVILEKHLVAWNAMLFAYAKVCEANGACGVLPLQSSTNPPVLEDKDNLKGKTMLQAKASFTGTD